MIFMKGDKLMSIKSDLYKFIPVYCEDKDFPDFMLSANSLEMKMLTEMAEKTGRDLSEMLTVCLHKSFKKNNGLRLRQYNLGRVGKVNR